MLRRRRRGIYDISDFMATIFRSQFPASPSISLFFILSQITEISNVATDNSFVERKYWPGIGFVLLRNLIVQISAANPLAIAVPPNSLNGDGKGFHPPVDEP